MKGGRGYSCRGETSGCDEAPEVDPGKSRPMGKHGLKRKCAWVQASRRESCKRA